MIDGTGADRPPSSSGTTSAPEPATAVAWARATVLLLCLSVGLVAATALLGPSAASPHLPGAGLLPPYQIDDVPTGGPSTGFVTALLLAAVAAGTAAVAAGWTALRRGWQPNPRRLLAASLLATALLVLVPTVGSSDVLSYAAYGRMTSVGLDPYATTPADLARTGDPIAVAVTGWVDTPSIYGPLTTAGQWAAAAVGDGSLRTTVVLLHVGNALGFVATVLLLYAGTRSVAQRRRALLLVGLNPLLLFQLVAAAHVDAWTAALLLAAVLALRRAPAATGLLVGLAVATKATAALALAGLAVVLWRRPRALAAVAVGALVVAVPAYLAAGPHVFDQARRASTFVAHANAWQPVALLVDGPGWRRVVTLLAWLVAAALAAWLLHRQRAARAAVADPAVRAARALAAVFLAYVVATAYVLPWYSAPVWVMLALLPPSRLDALLLAHTGMLSAAYLPGQVPVPDLGGAAGPVMRVLNRLVAPVVLLAVLVTAWRTGEQPPASRRRQILR